MSTISNIHLKETLEKWCDKLQMSPEDKEKAVNKVMEALNKAFPDGVPHDLLSDPVKRKNIFVGLMMAPLMEKIPELRFDLAVFFKAELNPEQTRKLFKTFLMELNKLEPDPNKRRTEKEIDADIDALLEQLKQEKSESKEEDSFSLANSRAGSDALDQIYIMLFSATRLGKPVIISVNLGNTGGFIDTYSAESAMGGSIHEGRGLEGDSTINPYVFAKAEQRLAYITGQTAEEINNLEDRGILPKPPQLKG